MKKFILGLMILLFFFGCKSEERKHQYIVTYRTDIDSITRTLLVTTKGEGYSFRTKVSPISIEGEVKNLYIIEASNIWEIHDLYTSTQPVTILGWEKKDGE